MPDRFQSADASAPSKFERRRFVVARRMRCAQNPPLPFDKGERIEVKDSERQSSQTRTLPLALSPGKGEVNTAAYCRHSLALI